MPPNTHGCFRRVGIAMAAYQPEPTFFAEQLESIRSQTCTDWFCVVCFDSPLGRVLEDERLGPVRRDPRFTFIQNPVRLGHKKNFERAIGECVRRGADAIACADQDDVWYPYKLARSLVMLNRRGHLGLVHSNMRILQMDGVNETMLTKSAWEFERRGIAHCRPEHLVVRNVVGGAGLLMDAQLPAKHPTVPEAFPFHDWWYAAVASAYGPIYPIHEPLYSYRQHSQNVAGLVSPRNISAVLSDRRRLADLADHRKLWLGARERARALIQAGVPSTRWFKLLFIYPDFGASLGLMGLSSLVGDELLGRACVARALGKACFWA